MKFSIAAILLVSTSSVVAFQQPQRPVSSLKQTGLRAIAIDPPTQPKNIPAPEPEAPKEPREPFDMTGIALSGLKGQALKWDN